MWPGYFTVGGNEVGNNARALSYTRDSDCPVTWIRDMDCGGIYQALDVPEEKYYYDLIQDAPWYDPDKPDLTSRFLGLYVISMEGASDSTRSAVVTEKIVDGAQVSGYRHTSRQVRIRALLTARGGDALEAGMTWLRNVLEPNACGVHGTDCGSSDFQFFVDCPPVRGTLPQYTAYAETRRNGFSNPRGTSTSGSYWPSPLNGALTLVTDMPDAINTAVRWTSTSAAIGRIGIQSGTGTPASGANLHFMAAIRASAPTSVTIFARPNTTSATSQTQLGGTYNLVAGMNYIDVTGASFAGANSSTSGVVIVTPVTTIGTTLDVTQVLIEAGQGPYFDGTTVDDALHDYQWVGTTDLSQSIDMSRSVIQVPRTNEEYELLLNDYWRVMHTVTCVSGPLVQSELKSNDGTHVGYIVEFTMLAAVPFVFSLPREIEVPPTTPTVVEDVAYNLEPYPSAEATNSTLVVATNYSTNPSVETNATDWAASTAIVSGTDPAAFFTSARVTGELSAVGTSSFRTRILGNNGGTVVTNARSYMYATQSVPFSTGTGVRVSFNIWAALLTIAGASGTTLNGIEVDVQWRATTTVLSTVVIGSTTTPADFAGKPFQSLSLLKPPTANNALVRARFDVTWSSSATGANNTDVRGYVDALAVTVP